MNVNVIEEIKKAEKQADDLLEIAKVKSKEIFNDAVDEANKQHEEIVISAKERYEKIVSNYKQQAENECVPINKSLESIISQILNSSDEKKKLAVKRIVERIVKYGNS